MPLLPLAKICCLRAVVASSFASLVLFFPLYEAFMNLKSSDTDFDGFDLKDWLSLGLNIFILIHHLFMSLTLSMELFGGFVDLPLLLFEIIGLGFHIKRLQLVPTGVRMSLPATTVHTTVSSILLISLSLEVVIRIGSFFSTTRSPSVSYHDPPVPDHTLEENFKPYQVIFGYSMRTSQFSENTPTSRVLGGSYVNVKIFLLRVVLASSFSASAFYPYVRHYVASEPGYFSFWLALLLLVILHHLLSCINFQFDYAWVDVPFLIFEIAVITPQFCVLLGWIYEDPLVKPSPTIISFIFLALLLFVGLVLETLIWATVLIKYLSYLFRKVQNSASPASEFTTKAMVPKLQHVLFGNSLWKKHVVGEMWIVTLSRGFLVILSILVLSAYSTVNIIISPVQENGAVPIKDMRMADARKNLKPAVWNVVFVHQATSHIIKPDMTEWDSLFQSAVNVTQISDSGFGWMNDWNFDGTFSPDSESGCIHAPGVMYPENPLAAYPSDRPTSPRVYLLPIFQVSTISCMSAPGDFLITVNFTKLQIPVGTMNNMTFNSLQIMIGLDKDSYKVIERTPGTTLIPGTNLFGTFTWDYRQVLKSPSLSTLGLFDSYEAIMVSRILSIIPDPLESPLIPHSPDIATLRLFMPYDISELRTIQDYRTSSVLQGLSASGGLWAFLSGVIGTIFGISILQILFGGKPISFLGLAHSLQRKQIQTAWKKKYQEIEDQVQESRFEGSLLSLLLDEVVDLEFLELNRRNNPTILQDTNMGNNESIILQDRNQVDEGSL